jgi:hypothetical protein
LNPGLAGFSSGEEVFLVEFDSMLAESATSSGGCQLQEPSRGDKGGQPRISILGVGERTGFEGVKRGGIWISQDRGSHWRSILKSPDQEGLFLVALDPAHPGTIFAGGSVDLRAQPGS